MRLADIRGKLPEPFYSVLEREGIDQLRPCQEKAVRAGLLNRKNLLVCTPTASGKTLVAEMAIMKSVLEEHSRAVYIVPMKALASEKYKEFKRKYGHIARTALSIGDLDASDPYLADYDIIIATSEKLDSLTRHHAPWVGMIRVIIVDEIHLLNDPERGPTLEILITMLRDQLKEVQIIALSATIGNPEELAEWLNAELVVDDWRPVRLRKGIYFDGEIEFSDE